MSESKDKDIMITVRDDVPLEHFLQQWNMLNLFPKLNEAGIDIDSLRLITERDLDVLFPEYNEIGLKILFRKKVVEWRWSNGMKEGAATLAAQTIPYKVDPMKTTDWLESCDTISVSTGSPTSSSSGNVVEMIFHKNEIDDMFRLPHLIDTLRKLQKYPQNTLRDLLCSKIVAHLLERKLTNLSSTNFLYIIAHILKHCPQEQAEFYFQDGPPKMGKLYNKYRNNKTNLRQLGLGNGENFDDEVVDERKAKESKDWLRYNKEPWDTVEKHWKATAAGRLSYFRKSTDKNTMKFLNEWPLIKSSKGYRLIDMDFEFLYPAKTVIFFKKFTKNYSIKLFLKSTVGVKNKTIKEAGIKIRETILGDEFIKDGFRIDHKNYVIAEIFKQLNGFLVPSTRIKSLNNSKIWRPTIIESFESFLYYIADVSEINQILASKKQKYADFGLTLQPLIFALQHNNEDRITKCFVYYDDIFYTFEDLMHAIDINFKIYFVMNLNYPFESCKIYKFLEYVIYEMSTSNDIPVKIKNLKKLLE